MALAGAFRRQRRAERHLAAVPGPTPDRDPLSPDVLRARWRQQSMEAGWRRPADWSVEEVDTVVAAAVVGRDLRHALERLGRARAAARVGLDEAVADLRALSVALGEGEVPTPWVVSLAVGWADLPPRAPVLRPLEHPVTGLVDPDYLRVRLHEVYREAEVAGMPAAARHALVLVELVGPVQDPWERAVQMVEVAESLRLVYSGGESLTDLGQRRAVALVRRTPQLFDQVAVLRDLVAEQLHRASEGTALVRVRVQVLELPEAPDQAEQALVAIASRAG